jgi:hypothetical protein
MEPEPSACGSTVACCRLELVWCRCTGRRFGAVVLAFDAWPEGAGAASCCWASSASDASGGGCGASTAPAGAASGGTVAYTSAMPALPSPMALGSCWEPRDWDGGCHRARREGKGVLTRRLRAAARPKRVLYSMQRADWGNERSEAASVGQFVCAAQLASTSASQVPRGGGLRRANRSGRYSRCFLVLLARVSGPYRCGASRPPPFCPPLQAAFEQGR